MRVPEAYNRVVLMGTVEWTTPHGEGFGMILNHASGARRVVVEFDTGKFDPQAPERFIKEGVAVLVDGELSGDSSRGHPCVIAYTVRSIQNGEFITHKTRGNT